MYLTIEDIKITGNNLSKNVLVVHIQGGVNKPAFTIKVMSYFRNDIAGNNYRSKPKDLKGTIPELFESGIGFLMESLAYLQ